MSRGDAFFSALALKTIASTTRSRTWQGIIGTPEISAKVQLTVRAEGGHYTMVELVTDQMGESRLDRNVKRFFVELHRTDEPRHELEAAY